MKLDIFNRAGDRAVKLDLPQPPRCADFDEDCTSIGQDVGPGDHGFRSHLECFLYDPQRGACPFLSTKKD